MSLRVLIVPDKFKGTLSAENAAEAMARGWKKSRPNDALELLPMSDGGEGFGEIVSKLVGAKPRKIKTVDAAHQLIETIWWWNPETKMAVIESAKIIGLAMLPSNKFHPFQLDTFGLGKVLHAARKLGCRHCVIGIGGSATNDGGFGMARALGWKFLNRDGAEIENWVELKSLTRIIASKKMRMKITVAVDVQNPLLGLHGATRVYGPQKGLREKDFSIAEGSLEQLSRIFQLERGNFIGASQVDKMSALVDFAKIPGAGAAGGLGFGLMTFANAKPKSGFEIFSRAANLKKRFRKTDLVLTGEGAVDQQTLMGKGVGQIALLCKKNKIRCIGIVGLVTEPRKAEKLFTQVHGLTQITNLQNAKLFPGEFLEKLAKKIAQRWRAT
jgi:glycerate kinase